jgi:hypothetical protein
LRLDFSKTITKILIDVATSTSETFKKQNLNITVYVVDIIFKTIRGVFYFNFELKFYLDKNVSIL